MTSDWIDRYFAAWARHAQAADSHTGAPEMELLLSFMADDVRYEDMPTGLVFVGHEGVRRMSAAAYGMSRDIEIRCVSSQLSGDRFAFEFESHGHNTGALGQITATGERFSLRGVAIGRVSASGKVVEHRDYWDLASFLAQIGKLRTG